MKSSTTVLHTRLQYLQRHVNIMLSVKTLIIRQQCWTSVKTSLTVRAWRASHSWEWILWTRSLTAIWGLQPHTNAIREKNQFLVMLDYECLPFQLLIDLVTKPDYVFPVLLPVGRVCGFVCGGQHTIVRTKQSGLLSSVSVIHWHNSVRTNHRDAY